VLFEPLQIKNVIFGNRVLRSSMGGRTAFYDGTVSPAWTHFEKRFARGGIGGIISATISVTETRMSPLEYPALHSDRFTAPLGEAIGEIRAAGSAAGGCKYIVQLGDTGAATHTSLRPQHGDRLSASWFFDFLYGYHNSALPMSPAQIRATIGNFKQAARRAVEAGCDGIEITASKGYLIHQFLNPATNRRTDAYGGSVDKRFRLLAEIVEAVRESIGPDFLLGVRLSAKDFNFLPVNIRFPPVWPPRHYFIGNGLPETSHYARRLQQLGVDYLHIDSGFGFPNPMGSPGDYPDDGFHTFVNATRYLSGKAEFRARVFNLVPAPIRKTLFGLGWRFRPAANADFAAAIRAAVDIPVIANGGFQDRDTIDQALAGKKCDMVAIARPLLANPDLLGQFARGANRPARPCSFCTLCCSHTAVFPLGCYDQRRFDSTEAMMDQILAWSSPNAPFDLQGRPLSENGHGGARATP
jgi:2,4-dienoyl-CoA reductase-like NADH-dependent reductase (Old Yellow Enzyme family)